MKLFDDFKILISLTVIFLCISFLGSVDFSAASEEVLTEDGKTIVKENKNKEDEETLEEEGLKPVNGVVIGFDKSETLTDVMIVGHIDPKNKAVNMISIPRDLHIDFTEEPFKSIKDANPNNNLLYCKLTEVYGYIGGDDRALEDVVSIIEEITGLEIEYYATVNINSFKDIVDSIGGVYFDVPQPMHYDDPYQDLHIHLDPGHQLMDGEKAEQLVRFRKANPGFPGYPNGDKDRVKVQQAFIKAIINQLLEERDFGKLKSFILTAYGSVTTNFGIPTVLEYADFFFDMDMAALLSSENMMTIDSGGYLIDGTWYELFNVDDARNSVKELLEKNNAHGKYKESAPVEDEPLEEKED